MGNPKGVERDFEQLDGDGLKPPGCLTEASIKGKWLGNWGFTANRSAVGIKPGKNKEPKPW